MYSCADFLRGFSDFRDGCMDPADRAEAEGHLAGCAGCARYLRVYDDGIRHLRALPEVEPSEDFLPKLQHRLYHIDEERMALARRDGSGASIGFVLVVMAMISVAAWLPLAKHQPPVVEMPAVAAVRPRPNPELHVLFRDGPLLTDDAPAARGRPATLFFRYTPLGSYASYQPGVLGLR